MKILLTVPSLERQFGGPSGKVGSLAAALERIGNTVRVAGVGVASAGSRSLPLRRFAGFHGTPIPRSLRPLRGAVEQADLVHVIGHRDPVGTAAALYSRGAGTPYLLEPVGMHRRRLRSVPLKAVFDATVGRLVVGAAERIIATAELEVAELVADGVDRERVCVRPNGVDFEGLWPLPQRGAIRSRFGIPDSAPLVLALGRITAKKGLPDTVRAVAGLDGVWLLVAGPDDGDGTLARLVALRKELGLTDRMAIEPEGLWGPDKAKAMADADVFALPSATENFGIAAAEAACCGLPVVVSKACGVKEWLDPASSRIVDAGDVAAVHAAFSELLGDSRARASAQKAGSELRDQLSWDRIAERQVRIYEAACAKRGIA